MGFGSAGGGAEDEVVPVERDVGTERILLTRQRSRISNEYWRWSAKNWVRIWKRYCSLYIGI